jgi:hypothetical protein
MQKLVLEIADLNEIHPGVSRGIALSYDEAVRVCLDRHHLSPKDFEIDGRDCCLAEVSWISANEEVKRAWANDDDATEQGAYGVALAAMKASRNLVAIRRAETRTGADYYVAPPDMTEDLEAAYRLEVSGTDKGNVSQIRNRFHQKVEQTRKGDSNLPAIVVIVGFSMLKIMSGDVETS